MCFVGDSFVAGVGDAERRGWVGRLPVLAQTRDVGVTAYGLTIYNLGIRLDTSADVRARWRRECQARFVPGMDNRLVLSFGVNDTTATPSGTRVAEDASCANLSAILTESRALGWPAFVVGPPPVADSEQNERLAVLTERFAGVCRRDDVRYVDTMSRLIRRPNWKAEVAAGDGSHPAAGGYQLLADIIFPPWYSWLSR
jgi:lysophospholipase L1-like esterase